MFGNEEELIVCYACGAPMNIATVAPYARVVCPECRVENRVKKQFGPYVLSRRHAIGGMSSVFVANDETLGREVAIKILSEEYSNDEIRIAAFEQEARLTASFSHPNVVRVLTTGRAFGRLYIAMEFVPGGHFEHQIKAKGRISEIELLPLAIQIAEGLKGAQAAGLIHRDIKPGNILLDAEGNAKIVDFGLALVTKGGKATATEIWATPYYVPPEAIEGMPEDFRSDIYAFGATLYHALAGKPPCNEETMATDKLRAAKKCIVPLNRAAPDLLNETCAVIDRSMAYDPSQRFGGYDEMIDGLRTALKTTHGETATDHHGFTKAERRVKLRRKKRIRIILMGGAALMAVAGLSILFAARATKTGEIEKPRRKAAVLLTPSGGGGGGDRSVDVASRYAQARKAMESGDLKMAEERFSDLLEDDTVQEPTRTWAGLQGIVTAMMDGRMDDARRWSETVKTHLSSLPADTGSGFRRWVLPVIETMDNPRFFVLSELDPGGESSEYFMGCLIAGLKNWEQGGLSQAVPFFMRISGNDSLSEDTIMAWHRKAVRAYLSDYKTLSRIQSEPDPNSPEACREYINNLNETLSLMKTRGRARFNIRALQHRFGLLEKNLRDMPPVPDDTLPEVIQSLSRRYDFREIVMLLSRPGAEPLGGKKDAVLRVARQAGHFMDGLGKSLISNPTSVALKLADGTEISSLVISEENKLMVKLTGGDIREIGWQDLPPGELLALHSALEGTSTDDEESVSRQISAISFDWLAGDRVRATRTAEELSAKDDLFRKAWNTISIGLPE